MGDERRPCGILLAAGLGSRFRQAAGCEADKLLARCPGRDGHVRGVLEHAVLALRPVVHRLLLVIRPGPPELLALGRAHGCEPLLLASAGLGDSLAAAVRQAPEARGWLIALGDMPFVLPQTVAQVARAMDEQRIVLPVHAGQPGHPVGFGRAFGPALARLQGERGARVLWREEALRRVAVADAGVLWDVDTPDRLRFAPTQAPDEL